MDCPICSRCATVNYSGEGYEATKNTWWLQSAPPLSLSKSTSGEKLLKRVTIQVLSSLLQHVPFLHYLTLSRAYLAHNWMSSPESWHSRKFYEQNKSSPPSSGTHTDLVSHPPCSNKFRWSALIFQLSCLLCVWQWRSLMAAWISNKQQTRPSTPRPKKLKQT